MDYQNFIDNKTPRIEPVGFDVPDSDINPLAHPWQRSLIRWQCRIGRGALFEDCGLGKTFQQLEWGRLVNAYTGGKVLLLCPPAVGKQTEKEAVKFGIGCRVKVVRDRSEIEHVDICVTNYQRLHLFDANDFVAVILDESSILKGMQGKVRKQLTETFRDTPFRLCCTATPAPNDHMELGNHAEFLGIMQASVMLSQYFTHDGGDTSKWRLKGHAKKDFWRWVSTWAACVSKPSDIGGDDTGYDLPPLVIHEHDIADDAWFVNANKLNATNMHDKKRETIAKRADVVAKLVGNNEPWAVWCDTNYEADALKSLVPEAVEVRGSDKHKAEKLESFTDGTKRVIISKPEVAGFGLNWQHCSNTTYFAGFSFERWYQSVRRLWRFGQNKPVNVHMIIGDGEHDMVQTLKRKQNSFNEMTSEMSEAMHDGMMESIYGEGQLRRYSATEPMEVPSFLKGVA